MPYKSKAQAAYFNIHRAELEKHGVNVSEWNAASKGMKLPKRAQEGGRKMFMNSNPVQGYFARRALSGMMKQPHVGPISGPTMGRGDKIPMSVHAGSYVLPADHVSSLGQGNTHAGFKVLSGMFPPPGRSVRSTIPKPMMPRAFGGRTGYAVGGGPAPTVAPTETGPQGMVQTNPGAISGAGSLASGPLWPGFTPSATPTPMIKNPNAASEPGQGYIPANYANELTAPSSLASASPGMLWNARQGGANNPALQYFQKVAPGVPIPPAPTSSAGYVAPQTSGNIPLGQPGSGIGIQLANNPTLTSTDQTALNGVANAPATSSIPGLTAPANATTSFAGGVVRARGGAVPSWFYRGGAIYRARGGRTHHAGDLVDIMAADGEHVLHPSQIIAKFGDLKRGHEELDKWVMDERKKHIHKLKKLPPPAKK